MAAVEEGIERAVLGVDSRTRTMSERERRLVAYHEAGHALVARALPDGPTSHKLTIVPRGGSLGRCSVLDERDGTIHTRSTLKAHLAALLGGLAAEDLVFGEPASGAGTDLRLATDLARTMVCELGMSSVAGPVFWASVGANGRGPERSEDAARMVDGEVRRLLDEAMADATAVLTMARERLDAVTAALLEHETLDGGELDRMLMVPEVPATR